MRIGLIGAGGIGKEWSKALMGHSAIQIVIVADVDLAKAKEGAQAHAAAAVTDWRQVAESDVEAAIVAVPHAMLAEISKGLLLAGKHVLCEKPGGISAQQVAEVVAIASERITSFFRIRSASSRVILPIWSSGSRYARAARNNLCCNEMSCPSRGM